MGVFQVVLSKFFRVWIQFTWHFLEFWCFCYYWVVIFQYGHWRVWNNQALVSNIKLWAWLAVCVNLLNNISCPTIDTWNWVRNKKGGFLLPQFGSWLCSCHIISFKFLSIFHNVESGDWGVKPFENFFLVYQLGNYRVFPNYFGVCVLCRVDCFFLFLLYRSLCRIRFRFFLIALLSLLSFLSWDLDFFLNYGWLFLFWITRLWYRYINVWNSMFHPILLIKSSFNTLFNFFLSCYHAVSVWILEISLQFTFHFYIIIVIRFVNLFT